MTPKTQDAPGETGQHLNAPQPDIPDEPGQTVAYAIYHPGHGFAETCTSAIDDFTDHQNEGHAILLFRQRDVAAADRLQRGWSDEAQIIPVRIPASEAETQAEDESTDEPESIPSVGEQFQVSDHCIVSVTLIRDAVMELQARLEGTVPGGNEHLHTRALEDRKPWTDPMNQLSNLNSDLLELLRYLCEQRESIHAEVVTD